MLRQDVVVGFPDASGLVEVDIAFEVHLDDYALTSVRLKRNERKLPFSR